MTKKLLFCHHDIKVLDRLLARPTAGKNVVIPCYIIADLIRTVAANEPHLVVVSNDMDPGVSTNNVEQRLRLAGFDLPVVVLTHEAVSDTQLDGLWRKLAGSKHEFSMLRRETLEHSIITETTFDLIATEGVVEDAAVQENRVLALLAAGANNQYRAKAYLHAVVANQLRMAGDWTLGLLRNDVSVYLWRSQLFRFVSLLAHYVPGVDIDCLPMPHSSSDKLDFVHTALSGEAFYALNAVRHFGIKPICQSALWQAGQIETRLNSQLPAEAAQLAGWGTIIHQVATATIVAMDALLTRASPGAHLADRRARTQFAMFYWFWNLTEFQKNTELLWNLADEFNAGRRATSLEPFCSFFDFADRIQTDQQCRLMQN